MNHEEGRAGLARCQVSSLPDPGLRLKEPLVNAMIHGRKPVADPTLARCRTSMSCLVFSLVAATGWLVWLLTFPI